MTPATETRGPMTFEQALAAWHADAPPMTAERWYQLRPLLDRQVKLTVWR